jgi:Zn ribbon nucleic-acid-binding protein
MGGKSPKVPSQDEIQKQQDAIAEKEKTKLAFEQAARDKKLQDKANKMESTRQSFVGGVTGIEDEEQRKRFLKGA